jgi:hypothetical protein
MSVSHVILELQQWYEAQCNGDWEHQYGISIETLDNPGWRVEIDLKDTRFAGVAFTRVEEKHQNGEWLLCRTENEKFVGAGDPSKLIVILQHFLEWIGPFDPAQDDRT